MKPPAMQFYVRDWMTDPALSLCKPATRGIWIDLLCAMWFAAPRGVVKGTAEELSRLARCSPQEMIRALKELENTGAANIIREKKKRIAVENRRMIAEEKERAGTRRRQQKLREKGGGDPDRWTALRVPILQRDSYTCAYCGRRANTVDHIIPKSKGGTEDPRNLVACCKRCNLTKSLRTMKEAGLIFWRGFDQSCLQEKASNTPGDTKVTPPSASAVSAVASATDCKTKEREKGGREPAKRILSLSFPHGCSEKQRQATLTAVTQAERAGVPLPFLEAAITSPKIDGPPWKRIDDAIEKAKKIVKAVNEACGRKRFSDLQNLVDTATTEGTAGLPSRVCGFSLRKILERCGATIGAEAPASAPQQPAAESPDPG